MHDAFHLVLISFLIFFLCFSSGSSSGDSGIHTGGSTNGSHTRLSGFNPGSSSRISTRILPHVPQQPSSSLSPQVLSTPSPHLPDKNAFHSLQSFHLPSFGRSKRVLPNLPPGQKGKSSQQSSVKREDSGISSSGGASPAVAPGGGGSRTTRIMSTLFKSVKLNR